VKTSREATFNMTSGLPQYGEYRTSGQKNISGTIGNKLVKPESVRIWRISCSIGLLSGGYKDFQNILQYFGNSFKSLMMKILGKLPLNSHGFRLNLNRNNFSKSFADKPAIEVEVRNAIVLIRFPFSEKPGRKLY